MNQSLQATVQSLAGEQVTLEVSDGQKLVVPISACEGMPVVGSSVRLVVAVLGSEDAGRQALARELLNDILSP